MQRSGILCAGAWCVDQNIAIDTWPSEEGLARGYSETLYGGCPGHNMSTALKRLDASFPVEAMGLLGHDANGQMLTGICDDLGIERRALAMREGVATARTLVMTARDSRKRTFIYLPGAHALQTPDDFDFSKTSTRIVHLGLPTLHEKLDAPWNGDASGWIAILKKARKHGLKTNMEMVSVSAEQIRAIARPMLSHLDTLVINDHEAGAIAGLKAHDDPAACRTAAESIMAMSGLERIAVHFPKGGIVMDRSGAVVEMPSVNVPPEVVVGNNGAGDSFAAGILYGYHEGWPLEKSLRLAHASAAASLRSETTTGAIIPWQECLALAEGWGWRT